MTSCLSRIKNDLTSSRQSNDSQSSTKKINCERQYLENNTSARKRQFINKTKINK